MTAVSNFNETFESARSKLRSFILRMTTNEEDTNDILQETYLRALDKLSGFREESSLETWIFTIAANLAKDLLRTKKRWPENVTDICREQALGNREFLGELMQIRTSSPHGAFEIKEHIAFCFTCVSKSLPIEQQLSLLLKEVYQFKVYEIVTILGLAESDVKNHLHYGRKKMMDIFDHRCALINKKGVCHQCTELNGIFNPKQDAQQELMKIRMVRDADHADKETLFKLRMEILGNLDPFESAASELQLRHLKHNHELMEKFSEET